MLYLSADFKPHKPQSKLIAAIKDGFDFHDTARQLSSRRRELLDQLINHPEGLAVVELTGRGFSRHLIGAMANDGYLDITRKSDDVCR